MKIILSGGETLGPVVPLLAVYEVYKKKYPDVQFVWVGTKNGPEKNLVEKYEIPFYAISTAKWRRYFSFLNVRDFFRFLYAFFQSVSFIWKQKPDILISAGGFISVPLHWAGAFFGVPAWVHQQDYEVGLANRLMAPFAGKITVAIEDSAKGFFPRSAEWVGNPVRDLRVEDKVAARLFFGIPLNSPVIFALGGGTGSAKINEIIVDSLQYLPKEYYIIHLIGMARNKELSERAAAIFSNYLAFSFFGEEMKNAYAVADLVVCRAGFGTITELAALKKPAIIIPMSGTHQEENAKYLQEKNAAIVMEERTDSGLNLSKTIEYYIQNKNEAQDMGDRLGEVLPSLKEEKIIEIINTLVKR